jgi:hypothetical protein
MWYFLSKLIGPVDVCPIALEYVKILTGGTAEKNAVRSIVLDKLTLGLETELVLKSHHWGERHPLVSRKVMIDSVDKLIRVDLGAAVKAVSCEIIDVLNIFGFKAKMYSDDYVYTSGKTGRRKTLAIHIRDEKDNEIKKLRKITLAIGRFFPVMKFIFNANGVFDFSIIHKNVGNVDRVASMNLTVRPVTPLVTDTLYKLSLPVTTDMHSNVVIEVRCWYYEDIESQTPVFNQDMASLYGLALSTAIIDQFFANVACSQVAERASSAITNGELRIIISVRDIVGNNEGLYKTATNAGSTEHFKRVLDSNATHVKVLTDLITNIASGEYAVKVVKDTMYHFSALVKRKRALADA